MLFKLYSSSINLILYFNFTEYNFEILCWGKMIIEFFSLEFYHSHDK